MRHSQLISDSIKSIRSKFPEAWTEAHLAAWSSPRGPEIAIVGLIRSAADYADCHFQRYESRIGDDGVLGDHWESIVRGTLGLLNGECGRFDCGTLDSLLRSMLSAEGFNAD